MKRLKKIASNEDLVSEQTIYEYYNELSNLLNGYEIENYRYFVACGSINKAGFYFSINGINFYLLFAPTCKKFELDLDNQYGGFIKLYKEPNSYNFELNKSTDIKQEVYNTLSQIKNKIIELINK